MLKRLLIFTQKVLFVLFVSFIANIRKRFLTDIYCEFNPILHRGGGIYAPCWFFK